MPRQDVVLVDVVDVVAAGVVLAAGAASDEPCGLLSDDLDSLDDVLLVEADLLPEDPLKSVTYQPVPFS